MKINPVLTILALLLGGLIFYGFYAASEEVLTSAIAGAMAIFSLIPAMGISFEDAPRMSVMFKTAAGVFFAVLLILNICLVWLTANCHVTIILNGIIFIIDLLVLYGIGKSKS